MLEKDLRQALGNDKVFSNEPMSKHTTFKIGGPAQLLVTPKNTEDVYQVLSMCQQDNIIPRVMGRGSNILVSDEGLPGVTMVLSEGFDNIMIRGNRIYADAGASNADVAAAAQKAGLAGYEFASGIPGTIGGAAIMNAGAYDGEFSQVCSFVTCLRPDLNIVDVPSNRCEWGYRHSLMMDDGSIVLGAALKLTPDDPAAIQARMDDLSKRRAEKQPLEMPSAGSTFKRPEGYFAGKLIDDAGLRGYRIGGAQVSEKHCGFVVNAGDATAEDVRQLIAHVQTQVYATSGVHIEPEVRMWGF